MEELSASQRELKEKDREISGHMERIRRLDADNDKLRDEVITYYSHHVTNFNTFLHSPYSFGLCISYSHKLLREKL